jgi:hypothetical protein
VTTDRRIWAWSYREAVLIGMRVAIENQNHRAQKNPRIDPAACSYRHNHSKDISADESRECTARDWEAAEKTRRVMIATSNVSKFAVAIHLLRARQLD